MLCLCCFVLLYVRFVVELEDGSFVTAQYEPYVANGKKLGGDVAIGIYHSLTLAEAHRVGIKASSGRERIIEKCLHAHTVDPLIHPVTVENFCDQIQRDYQHSGRYYLVSNNCQTFAQRLHTWAKQFTNK